MTGERAHICEHGPRQGAEVLVEMNGRAGAPWGTGDVSGSRDMAGLDFRQRRWWHRLRYLGEGSSLLTRASNILAAPLRSLRGGLPWRQAISFAAVLSNTAESSSGGQLGEGGIRRK